MYKDWLLSVAWNYTSTFIENFAIKEPTLKPKYFQIYPSEYGLERMKEEEVRGPIELTEDKLEDFREDGGNEEGLYQFYLSIVTCNWKQTSETLQHRVVLSLTFWTFLCDLTF